MSIQVIGAGLAGCEAAWQVASAGIPVLLREMKPRKFTPAHRNPNFAELICSNSLKADRMESAAGLLKEEMRRLGSLLMACADQCRVPAGGALAVNRELFAELVTQQIRSHPLITVVEEEVTELPRDTITVVASGPLTADSLADQIFSLCGGRLRFFDAAAPIVTAESLNPDRCFSASRYEKGDGDDYINCPMNKEEYEAFHDELVHAERAPVHDFDVQNPKVYEGCMPIEVLAQRGLDTMRFGPLKPVGLRDPRTGHRPWAVVQLRKENTEGSLLNLVGFQTNLKFGEQLRVFRRIPGLEQAEFMRYGVMHRNTFLNGPQVLNGYYQMKQNPALFFAGQMTGVEGYMESASSGLMAGLNAARLLLGQPLLQLPETSMIGALSRHVSESGSKDYQPMGANFGVLPPLETPIRDKKARYTALAQRGLAQLDQLLWEEQQRGRIIAGKPNLQKGSIER